VKDLLAEAPDPKVFNPPKILLKNPHVEEVTVGIADHPVNNDS
jgi:hypothetical protein